MNVSTSIQTVVIGALAFLVLAPQSSGAEPAVRTLLASAPQDIRFQIDFDAPEPIERELEGQSYRHLVWKGLATVGEPGAPALPVTYVRVAVPGEAKVRLSVQVRRQGSADNLRFPPAATWMELPARRNRWEETIPRAQFVEGEAYAQDAFTPYARIQGVGIERGLRVATIAVSPVAVHAKSGRAEWAASVTVTVLGTGGIQASSPSPGGGFAIPRPDRVAQAAWAGTLVNPADADRYRVGPAALPQPGEPGGDGLPAAWFDETPGWVKIRVKTNGMIALSRSELAAQGVPVTTVDPRTFRIYAGPLIPEVGWADVGWDTLNCTPVPIVSKSPHVYDTPGFGALGFTEAKGFDQVAIWVPGEGDGMFDGSDKIVFYGLGPDNYRDRFGLELNTNEDYLVNPHTDHTVYWLTWDALLPDPPRRMLAADAAPGTSTPITQGTARLHVERNTIYDPSMYLGGYRWEGWFWDFLSSDSGVKRFRVDLPGVVPGSVLSSRIRFWGSKVPTRWDTGEAALHHVRVTVNGQFAGLFLWGSRTPAESLTPFDMDAVNIPVAAASPTQDFQFLVPQVNSSDPTRLDQIHLTWLDVSYQKAFALSGQSGELEVDGGAGGRRLRVSGAPPGAQVFDVTDFRNPRRLINGTLSGGTLEFAVDDPGRRVVAVASDGTYAPAAAVEQDDPPRVTPGGAVSWLRDTSAPLDYVIIAYDDFDQEAELLAEWRRQHLYPITPDREANVRVVRVSDIMDEFAWGMSDPAALRHFLEYAFRYYGQAGDDPLSYCLFLGDATNDPRNYGGSGVRNLVPSWEDNRDGIIAIFYGNVQYVSDDPLARFDGVDSTTSCIDLVTDLYIGRITATSAAGARELILNKVIRSEKNPDYGTWRTKAILVADDICQGRGTDGLGFTHMRQMELVSDTLPPEFDQDKIYLYEYGAECTFPTKPEAKQALLSSWNEGAWLVNYIGHGADVVWADEHVLDLADTPLLNNENRLPVVGSFSCSVGKFSNPTRDGLGESHLRNPRGGSLVSAAATHLTSSFGNHAFNLEFIRQLFPDGTDQPVPIGVAMMNAKRIETGQAGKYVCLGDPASRLSVPERTLQIEAPASLERGALVGVTVRLPKAPSGGGVLDLVARDARLLRDTGISINDYRLPGSVLFRGQTENSGDSVRVDFTIPTSLRGGDDGKIRGYFWGRDWDALGARVPLSAGMNPAVASPDTVGPVITFSVTEGGVSPGEQVTVTLEDPSGINLTQLFDFRSIFLKIVDARGLEQARVDLTENFSYEMGSSTRGALAFGVPDLESEPYTFTLSATDNYNNRTQETVVLQVGEVAGQPEFTEIMGAYPNPYNPEQGSLHFMFSLNRSAEVTVRIYTVSGRLVRQETLPGIPGSNAFIWDGRDARGDEVANGVYLMQLSVREDDTAHRHLERLVVLR